jgi:hypothetical protein
VEAEGSEEGASREVEFVERAREGKPKIAEEKADDGSWLRRKEEEKVKKLAEEEGLCVARASSARGMTLTEAGKGTDERRSETRVALPSSKVRKVSAATRAARPNHAVEMQGTDR